MSATAIPLIPDTAPFTSTQRAWLNGFFAGVFSRGPETAAAASPAALAPLTILYGSQTGTAEGLARRAAKEAGRRGFAPAVLDMAEASPARLAGEKNLLVLTSTYGEGEPPDNARALWEGLAREDAPRLPGVRYAVFALGDSRYAQFCQCGKDFDARLERLGAARAATRADADLEADEPFRLWLDRALAALAGDANSVRAETDGMATAETAVAAPDRNRPFAAPLLVSRNLNGAGSAKATHHVEFSLEGSGLSYEAGDALGVLPTNDPALVAEVLRALGCDGEEAVPGAAGGEVSLRHALTNSLDLSRPPPLLLEALRAGGAAAADLAAVHDVSDALRTAGARRLAAAEFAGLLRKLQPRLYSISSSPAAHAGRAHLTVGVVRYEAAGQPRAGVCSAFLAERAAGGATIPVFVHANKSFRLPADPAAPAIMIGPGTGIAPFRAFLHERRARGATGRNWLFFGDQRAATDFLYRDELMAMRADGLLTRLDTAFSRDQAEKVYVQHRMAEHARELHAWIEAGAHVYVCGDAARMAKDVHAALEQVFVEAGGRTREQAAERVRALQAAKRYQRDVY